MLEKQELYRALRQMENKYLKEPYKSKWSALRPTTGYCYVVCEVLHHYYMQDGSFPHVVKIPNGESHWFLRDRLDKVVDLTADQYDIPIPYDQGKRQMFMTKKISKRGKALAMFLGISNNP